MKRWHIVSLLVLTIVVMLVISACGTNTDNLGKATPSSASSSNPGAFKCVAGTLTISGSTALQPYVDAVAKKYESKCSSAKITVLPGGSKKGLADAENGTSQIGNSDVFANASQSDLVDHQVAVVIFTLIINPNVQGISNLTTSDIQGIYTGKITNWKQVGGPDTPITVVSRPTSSGTRATFKKYILNGANESPAQSQNLTVESTGTVIDTVAQTKGAIGYVSLGGALGAGSKVTILKIDGKEASEANAVTNDYKFWNIEHMYTKGQPGSLAQAFLDYMSSDDATQVATQLKFAKISQFPQDVRATHK